MDLLEIFDNIRSKNITYLKSQYRSIIFANIEQKQEATIFIKNKPNIQLLSYPEYEFQIAEDYHQKHNFQKKCNHLNTEDINVFHKICKNNSQNAEDAYTGEYLSFFKNGIYLCGCCKQELYSSQDKYDSGSGWPAFSQTISENNILYNPKNDELRCSGCGLHLGHRSFDGPTKTKIHDCINSTCLSFKYTSEGGGKHSRKIKKKKTNKKQFLYNPNDPKKSFDVYIDKNPNDTIPIKYTTLIDVKNTILKLEKLYKKNKYTHKRIWQVGMILYVRLKVLKDKKPREFKLAKRYFKHLGERTKIKDDKSRRKFIFKM